ncbi:MAG: 4-hydroxy-tetrahydrodipicolinate reductase [Bacillota bacterium]
MKIGIAGFGRMGRLIYQKAFAAGHEVVVIVDPSSPAKEVTDRQFTSKTLRPDVIIDFTVPGTVVKNIKKYTEIGVSAVIGTTGWYDEMDEVASIVENSKIGLIWSVNFSLGVNIFFQLLKTAGEIINKFHDYDAAVHEIHHCNKADSPSGTAKTIGEILLSTLDRKQILFNGIPDRVINEEELIISSTRCGAIPGIHQVIFDSEVDTITLEHRARNREGFAAGALVAAEWVCSKRGFYSIDDLVDSIIGGEL